MRCFRLSGMAWSVIVCVMATLCVLAIFLGGCAGQNVDPAALQQINAKVQAGVDAANAEAERAAAVAAVARDDAKKALDALSADADRSQAQQKLDEAVAKLQTATQTATQTAKLKEQAAVAGKAVAAAVDPDGAINPSGVANVVAPLLPPPWNVVVIGAGLVGTIVLETKRRQALTALKSVVDGLETAKRGNTNLSTGLKESAPILLENYTPLAKEVVRKAAA